MIALLKEVSDRLLGRGEAAITVPPMDGPLKPNHVIDNAEVVAELNDGNDLASDGETLWIAEGRHLLRLQPGGEKELVSEFPEALTALAGYPLGASRLRSQERKLRSLAIRAGRPRAAPSAESPSDA